MNELQTLADYGRLNPAIDPAFNNGVDSFTQSNLYWSSTTAANGLAAAWYVHFFHGSVDASGKTTGFRARTVRGGS